MSITEADAAAIEARLARHGLRPIETAGPTGVAPKPEPVHVPSSSTAEDSHALMARQLEESGLPPFEADTDLPGPESTHEACGGTGQTKRGRCGHCGGTGRRRASWRVDFLWRRERIALEVDGSVHAIRANQERDAAKSRWMALTGWLVIRVLAHEVRHGTALGWVERAFQARAPLDSTRFPLLAHVEPLVLDALREARGRASDSTDDEDFEARTIARLRAAVED